MDKLVCPKCKEQCLAKPKVFLQALFPRYFSCPNCYCSFDFNRRPDDYAIGFAFQEVIIWVLSILALLLFGNFLAMIGVFVLFSFLKAIYIYRGGFIEDPE